MPPKLLARLLVLGCCAWIAFWACAPPTVMPPPTPFPKGADVEWGGAIQGEVGLTRYDADVYGGGAGQFWRYKKIDKRSGWGLTAATGIGAEGYPFGAAGGTYQRMAKNKNIGFAVDGGWTYLRVGMPILVPIGRGHYMYLRPTAGSDLYGLVQLPVGFQFGRKNVFRVESGVRVLGASSVSSYLAVGSGWRF